MVSVTNYQWMFGAWPVTRWRGSMAHVRGLCGPLLEMLYWTCLCEGSGLSIAHVIRHCHIAHTGWFPLCLLLQEVKPVCQSLCGVP